MSIDVSQILKMLDNPQIQQLVKNMIGQFTGGGGGANLQGLVDQMNQGGLGEQLQSWLGQGQNEPVSGAQLKEALGPQLDAAAQQSGLAPQQAADDLAKVLPQLIDKASPSGQLAAGQPVQEMLGQLFGGAPRTPAGG